MSGLGRQNRPTTIHRNRLVEVVRTAVTQSDESDSATQDTSAVNTDTLLRLTAALLVWCLDYVGTAPELARCHCLAGPRKGTTGLAPSTDQRDILLAGQADSMGLWLDHDHEGKRLTWR